MRTIVTVELSGHCIGDDGKHAGSFWLSTRELELPPSLDRLVDWVIRQAEANIEMRQAGKP